MMGWLEYKDEEKAFTVKLDNIEGVCVHKHLHLELWVIDVYLVGTDVSPLFSFETKAEAWKKFDEIQAQLRAEDNRASPHRFEITC